MLVAAEAVWLWTSGCAAAMKLRSPVARVRALLNRRCCSVAGSLIRSSVNDHENETLTKRTRSLIRNKLRNTKNKFLRKKVFFFFLFCCAAPRMNFVCTLSEVKSDLRMVRSRPHRPMPALPVNDRAQFSAVRTVDTRGLVSSTTGRIRCCKNHTHFILLHD